MGSRLATILTVAAAVAGLLACGAAAAPPKPDSSAIMQYVEMVPTSSGSIAPGLSRAQAAHLTKRERAALTHAGANAALLAKVATSPDYGAPTTQGHGLPAEAMKGKADAVSATAAAVTDIRGGLVLLVLALGAVTALIVGSAVRGTSRL